MVLSPNQFRNFSNIAIRLLNVDVVKLLLSLMLLLLSLLLLLLMLLLFCYCCCCSCCCCCYCCCCCWWWWWCIVLLTRVPPIFFPARASFCSVQRPTDLRTCGWFAGIQKSYSLSHSDSHLMVSHVPAK